MIFAITPSYSDLFNDPPESYRILIENIDIQIIIQAVSNTNAQLYLEQSNSHIQKRLFFSWIHEQPSIEKFKLTQAFNIFIHKNGNNTGLFSSHFLLGFLHECLVIHRQTQRLHKSDTPDANVILSILKAYVIYVDDRNTKITIPKLSADHFFERTWPLMIQQNELNTATNYMSIMIKSMCLFDYFQYELGKEINVKQFLKRVECVDGKNYAYSIGKLVQDGTNTGREGKQRDYLFRSLNEFIPLYDFMSLNLETYHNEHNASKNLTGIKKTPIFKINEDTYYVIDWNLFARKVYDGLVFDFYMQSGIKNDSAKGDFVNHYLPLVSEMVEKHLFRRLISSIFSTANSAKILFDENGIDGAPDAYVRIGKRIFLFEVKDSFFSAKAIDSGSYSDIKKELDRKFNKGNKGTGQLINQLNFLLHNSFEEKSFLELNLKHRNLVIYPVIVYTDPSFGLLGTESYLNDAFRSKLEEQNLDSKYGLIRRLSFINIDFFLEKIMPLKKSKNRLDKLIDQYDQNIKRKRKKYLREQTMENHFNMYYHFEDVTLKKHTFKDDTGYIQQVFEDLDLMRGFADEE